jgi:hypothetical protein
MLAWHVWGTQLGLSGGILFLPWVTLPAAFTIGGFRFAPVTTADPTPVVGPEMASTVAQALSIYRDKHGKQIDSCTMLLRPRHTRAWDIPDGLMNGATRATEILALACLAEQRFLEGHFSPHLNATMFRLIGQGVSAGSNGIGLLFPRRGGGLSIGGCASAMFRSSGRLRSRELPVGRSGPG